MNRRGFFAIVGTLGVLGVTYGVVSRYGAEIWYALSERFTSKERGEDPRRWKLAIAEDLREHFSYLILEDELLEAYLVDLERRFDGRDPRRILGAHKVHTLLLMSTDFFLTGADETRPLRYVALYGPYISPCFNPLAISQLKAT